MPRPPTPDPEPHSLPPFPSAHPVPSPSDPLAHPPPDPEPSLLHPTPRELYRLAVSAGGHGGIRGNQRNHAGPDELLRQADGLVDVGTFVSDDPEVLRRRAAEIRLATALAVRLEEAALDLQDAEEEAALVRRRVQRSQKSFRRKTDLEARRSAGGLYAGEHRSPNRPTHVEVDDGAWTTLKARAARRRQTIGRLVGDLVAAAAAAGLPSERHSERRRSNVQITGERGRRASRSARLFLPDDDTWARFRACAVDESVSIARAVGLVVEHEARRHGWRPEAWK